MDKLCKDCIYQVFNNPYWGFCSKEKVKYIVYYLGKRKVRIADNEKMPACMNVQSYYYFYEEENTCPYYTKNVERRKKMKKIPTLFERLYDRKGRIIHILPIVTSDFEWVLNGEGIATIKWDGSCCAIINGELYKRYDAKKGKNPPESAIPCKEKADPITGHFPYWVKCDRSKPEDKWFFVAFDKCHPKCDGTYEAIGEHFNSNPYNLKGIDILIKHGEHNIDDEVPRTFEGIREYLRTHFIEGIVFWKDGQPQCKIKRSDFGFPWGRKKYV